MLIKSALHSKLLCDLLVYNESLPECINEQKMALIKEILKRPLIPKTAGLLFSLIQATESAEQLDELEKDLFPESACRRKIKAIVSQWIGEVRDSRRAFSSFFPKAILDRVKLLGISVINGYIGYTTLAKLDQRVGGYLLSPVHVAVMMRDHFSLEALLEAGANPDVIDMRQWTPAHHAAACGDTLALHILKKYGAFCTQLNKQEGTPYDLLQLISPPLPLASTKTLLRTFVDNREREQTVTYFFEPTPQVTAFSQSLHFTSFGLFLQWWKPSLAEQRYVSSSRYERMVPPVKNEYSTFIRREPQLAITNKLELVSTTIFMPGEIVCEFGGDLFLWHAKTPPGILNESLGNVSSFHTANYAMFATHGHPNSAPIRFFHSGALRTVLVALEPILYGETIVYNHLAYRIAHPHYSAEEARPHSFETFWKEEEVQKALHQGIDAVKFPLKAWDSCSFMEKLLYPAYSMSAFYRIVLKDIATPLHLGLLFRRKDFDICHHEKAENFDYYLLLKFLLEKINKLPPRDKQIEREKLLKQLDVYKIKEIRRFYTNKYASKQPMDI